MTHYPNPKTIHTFCVPKNCSGVQKFRLNISDPTTRDIFNALIDNRTDNQGNDRSKPAYTIQKYIEPDDGYDPTLPEVISCDISCLPTIELFQSTPEEDVFGLQFNNDLNFDLRVAISLGTTAKDQFIRLLNHLSDPFYMYAASFATDDKFFVYMLFDDKLPVSWGQLLDIGGQWIRDTSVPLRFPLDFETVTIAIYSENADKFYPFFTMFLPF